MIYYHKLSSCSPEKFGRSSVVSNTCRNSCNVYSAHQFSDRLCVHHSTRSGNWSGQTWSSWYRTQGRRSCMKFSFQSGRTGLPAGLVDFEAGNLTTALCAFSPLQVSQGCNTSDTLQPSCSLTLLKYACTHVCVHVCVRAYSSVHICMHKVYE